MKFLKIRYILTLAIVLILGVSLLVYFFGGLEAKALSNNNLEFDLTNYFDYKEFDKDGVKTVTYNSLEELNKAIEEYKPEPADYDKVINEAEGIYKVTYRLNSSRIVAQNKEYTMFLNEKTTIVSIAKNSECQAPAEGDLTVTGYKKYNKSTCEKIYDTAITDEAEKNNEAKSNFVLYYIGSNDKLSTIGFNTYQHSVLYNDLLEGSIKRHYQIKFNGEENYIEVLYEIGDFTVINSFFPQEFKRSDLENYFRGNLVFVVDNGEVTSKDNLKYTSAYTWSKECAAYLEEKGLATVTEDFASGTDPLIDENGNPIPAKWNLTDILEKDSEGRTLNKLKMQIGVDYNPKDITAPDASPCVANPFMNTYIYGSLFRNYFELISQKEDDEEYKYNTDWRFNVKNSSPTFRLKATGTLEFQKMFEYMYKENKVDDENFLYGRVSDNKKIPTLYDENPYDDIKGVKVPIGGFQARDEQGNFLFNEDNSPKQQVFTKAEADLQNDIFGNFVESNSPRFQVAMRFTLTEEGLETNILNNSLKEGLGSNYRDEEGKPTVYSHDCVLGSIDVLPYFTSNNSLTSEGQIILPDGSGAIMSFNSTKDALNYTAFSKQIYGPDKTFTFRQQPKTATNEYLMFGMYGFLDKTEGKGVLAIADKGANLTSIDADFKRAGVSGTMNIARFQAIYRESETVYAGTTNTPFLKWANDYAKSDLNYIYQFLDRDEFIDEDGKIQYVKLAENYREYLINKYNLEAKDKDENTKTKNNIVSLNFLGAFEKRQVSMGFPYYKDFSLTTFAQAEEIIKELKEEGINDFSVSYSAWTKDAMEPEATSNPEVSSVLGKLKGLKSFNDYLKQNNIDFYPEVRIASNKGYDYNFGNMKYTAKSIGSTYAQHREYVLATNMANSTISPVTMVSPRFYNALATKYMDSYLDFNVKGAYLSDLGNLRMGDYRKGNNIYAEQGMNYQADVMNLVQEKVGNVLLSAPFDYALQYANFAVNVPLESSLMGYYDYTIPFYQLVVSGLFDYAGPAVNYDSEHSSDWYLLKSLETGSNLNFILSYEDTKELLDTNYTMFYNAYYANWKNEIIRMNNIINSTGIHKGTLIDHKILKDNVYQVKYSNGTVLIINYNKTTYFDINAGLSVRPNWFTVLEEGK